LDPNLPKQGVRLKDKLRRKYGADLQPMFERVEAAAKHSGILLDCRSSR
jgi:predicted DsbA family dithiol-disulfide isomerase